MDEGRWQHVSALMWASVQPHQKKTFRPDHFSPYRKSSGKDGIPVTADNIQALRALVDADSR